MKKILIAVAVVAASVVANAATFNWKTGTGQQVYLMNSTDRAASMTAYLFDASIGQQAVLSAFDNGTFGELAKLDTQTTTSAGAVTSISTGSVTYGNAGDTLTAFFAVIASVEDKDYLFISDTANGVGKETGITTLTYSAKDASQLAANEFAPGAAIFGSSGWYTAAAVPEPTSGLLMLLGMAGLALRRRRA